MLKRYIVIVYNFFSGCHGWFGAVGFTPTGTPPDSFDTIEEAVQRGEAELSLEYGPKFEKELAFQVVDLHSGLIVFESTE